MTGLLRETHSILFLSVTGVNYWKVLNLHEVVKLSEHSKHEHRQRNIPPGLIKMYMGVPDYYRLNRVAWDESTELEGDKNFAIGRGSFRE